MFGGFSQHINHIRLTIDPSLKHWRHQDPPCERKLLLFLLSSSYVQSFLPIHVHDFCSFISFVSLGRRTYSSSGVRSFISETHMESSKFIHVFLSTLHECRFTFDNLDTILLVTFDSTDFICFFVSICFRIHIFSLLTIKEVLLFRSAKNLFNRKRWL